MQKQNKKYKKNERNPGKKKNITLIIFQGSTVHEQRPILGISPQRQHCQHKPSFVLFPILLISDKLLLACNIFRQGSHKEPGLSKYDIMYPQRK